MTLPLFSLDESHSFRATRGKVTRSNEGLPVPYMERATSAMPESVVARRELEKLMGRGAARRKPGDMGGGCQELCAGGKGLTYLLRRSCQRRCSCSSPFVSPA